MTELASVKAGKRFWELAKIFLAISLLYLVISKTNIQELLLLKDEILWGWVIGLVFLTFGMTLMKAFQYYALLGDKENYWHILRITILQNAIANFVATSAGIASYLTLLKKEENIGLSRSGGAFILTKFGDLLAIFFYLVLTASLIWTSIEPLHEMTILLALGIVGALSLFVLTIWWRERFVDGIVKLFATIRIDRWRPVQKGIDMLNVVAREDQHRIFSLLKTSILLSLIYMTMTMLLSWMNLKAFNIELGIWPIVYVAAIMQLITYIPVHVLGGVGVIEVSAIYLYGIWGLEPIELAAALLGMRVLFYATNASTLLYFPLKFLYERNREKRTAI